MMAGGSLESEISAINKPTGGWSPARPMDWGSRFVLVVTLLAGLFITAAGVAALLAPRWFADAAGFPRHTHFVHDAAPSSSASGSWWCWRWPGATGSPWCWPAS
jgi:hypothetical protein